MRLWIIMLQMESRKEYPSHFLLEATSEEGNEIERQIRELFERGIIKNFSVEPIRGPVSYGHMVEELTRIEEGE